MVNPKSTASIAGHPVHPMLVPFPIAFFVATFVCDLVYWQTISAAWATAAVWLLGAGLVMAAFAAIVGLIDVFGDQRIRALNDVWWHAGGNVFVVLIELYSFYARYTEGAAATAPKGLVISLVAVGILLFTGWKGGEMVYRYRVGVMDTNESRPTASTETPTRRAA
jgi:uncharacterized membrane protein